MAMAGYWLCSSAKCIKANKLAAASDPLTTEYCGFNPAYGINGHRYTATSGARGISQRWTAQKVTSIRRASQIIALAEVGYTTTAGDFFERRGYYIASPNRFSNDVVIGKHSSMNCNFVFSDGHAVNEKAQKYASGYPGTATNTEMLKYWIAVE